MVEKDAFRDFMYKQVRIGPTHYLLATKLAIPNHSQVALGDIPSLRLLAAMAERAPTVFASTAVPSLPSLIQQVCTACLTNNTNNNHKAVILEALMQVLVQAAIATQQQQPTASALLSFASKPVDTVDPTSSAAALGRTCLPVLMEHLSASLSASPSNNNSSILAILQQWTNAATHCPSLLAGTKEVLEAVFSACLVVANARDNNDDDDSTTALAALEVLSSLCAVGDVKRKILAVDPVLCQTLVQGNPQQQNQPLGVIALAAQLMTTGVDDDVEEWASEPASLLEDDQWEGDDAAWYAESLFQSFLHSLAAPALAVALPLVENRLQTNHADWRRQRAGLSMMEACLTSAPVSFTPHVPVAVEAALSLATSAQPTRVQWQALRLLGVLCETDVTLEQSNHETVRQHYSLRILQGLSQAVQSPCSKVSSLACLAIVSYCRGGATGKATANSDDSPHPVTQYLSDLLQALVAGPLSLDVVNRGAIVVKIRAIGAVACLAEASGEAFAPFYASIMPGLLTCSQMQHRGNHEMTQLIGAAIESATIVGQATEADEATRARYVTDGQQIMHFIVPILQQAEAGSSDMPLDQLLSACARIAAVMGPDYAPFVKLVLPHLLNRATTPPDVSVTVSVVTIFQNLFERLFPSLPFLVFTGRR